MTEREMPPLPSFVIIGAMKSATSTLYEQLRRQPGIFMPALKEPNFFSDANQFAKGLDWYGELFAEAAPDDIVGEASTHYAKMPTYPETVHRLHDCLGTPKLVYVMRHPVDRLVSQYMHQWGEGDIRVPLEHALTEHDELVAYSLYAEQLQPYIATFGKANILPMFFDRILSDPHGELARLCSFIGYTGTPNWFDDKGRVNASAERVRKFPLYDLLIDHPAAEVLRRRLVPKTLRNRIRSALTVGEKPILTEDVRRQLNRTFDADLSTLGTWLGCDLSCDNFRSTTGTQSLNWN
jgi:sulfotransferase family protein